MNIGIDARWIYPQISGVGRVTEKLIRYLGEIDQENRYLIFFFQPELKEKYEKSWEKYPNLELVLVPWPLFSPADQIRMPAFLRKQGVDVFHSTNYLVPLLGRGLKMVSTIHDLIPLKFPHFTPRAKKTRYNFLFRMLLRRCARKADRVIAVSRHTRDDLVKYLGLEEEKIAVVYNGVAEKYRPRKREEVLARLPEKVDRERPYALYVGRFDPYKNAVGLVREFKRFLDRSRPEANLVLAGHYDPRYPQVFEEVEKLGLASRVIFLDQLGEEDLIYLYRGARVLVLPSFYEGFGLPPLEAMACGTPVICSNRGSLPEVVGEAAIVIDPGEEGSIARALEKIWTDDRLAAELREKGLARAGNFTWKKTAEETLAVYRSLLSSS